LIYERPILLLADRRGKEEVRFHKNPGKITGMPVTAIDLDRTILYNFTVG